MVRDIIIPTGIAVISAIRYRRYFPTVIAAITDQITPVTALLRLQEAISRRHLHHRLHQAAQAAAVEAAVVVQAGLTVKTRNLYDNNRKGGTVTWVFPPLLYPS